MSKWRALRAAPRDCQSGKRESNPPRRAYETLLEPLQSTPQSGRQESNLPSTAYQTVAAPLGLSPKKTAISIPVRSRTSSTTFAGSRASATPRGHQSAEGEGVEPSRAYSASPRFERGAIASWLALPFIESGRLDLNQRSPVPETGGLTGLSHIQIVRLRNINEKRSGAWGTPDLGLISLAIGCHNRIVWTAIENDRTIDIDPGRSPHGLIRVTDIFSSH
jgi:hypothetical protein